MIRILSAALHPLPVAALRLSPEIGLNLRMWGSEKYTTYTDDHKRQDLLVRFGEELLRRLDQMFGRVSELIQPFRIKEALAVHRTFDGATTQLEAVLMTAQELIAELSQLLLKVESGVRGMRLELKRIHMPPLSREEVLGRTKPRRQASLGTRYGPNWRTPTWDMAWRPFL